MANRLAQALSGWSLILQTTNLWDTFVLTIEAHVQSFPISVSKTRVVRWVDARFSRLAVPGPLSNHVLLA